MSPREEAEIEAKKTYVAFLKLSKYTFYGALAFFLVVASCNFGVEEGPNATGSKYEPENAKEYHQRMIEMGEKYKNK